MHPIDWQIISILQEDGKTTYGELAKRVGLSQAAAHERVKKLEARGVIKGYRAVVDAEALGYGVVWYAGRRLDAFPRRSLQGNLSYVAPVAIVTYGLIAALLRSDLGLPEQITKFLALYLLMSIGFRGGAEVAHHGLSSQLVLTMAAGVTTLSAAVAGGLGIDTLVMAAATLIQTCIAEFAALGSGLRRKCLVGSIAAAAVVEAFGDSHSHSRHHQSRGRSSPPPAHRCDFAW